MKDRGWGNNFCYRFIVCLIKKKKDLYYVLTYEARVRLRIRVQVRDSAIFKKVGCGGVRRLKNY